jgi:hypothetical protein
MISTTSVDGSAPFMIEYTDSLEWVFSLVLEEPQNLF